MRSLVCTWNDKTRKARNAQDNVKKKTLRNDIGKKKEWYEKKTTGIIRLIDPSHLKWDGS